MTGFAETDTDANNEARKRVNRSNAEEENIDQSEPAEISTNVSPTEEQQQDTNMSTEQVSAPTTQSTTEGQLETPQAKQAAAATNAFRAFGGKNAGNDDWGEFAGEESDDDDKDNGKGSQETEAKQSPYKFGSTSGFGTKGWALQRESTSTTTESSASKVSHCWSNYSLRYNC